MNKRAVSIIKASGAKATYSPEHLRRSLAKSGADNDTIDMVLSEIDKQLYEGMPTHKIYRIAFKLLRKASRHYAAKFRLKQAIMELGPSGFPFEKYVAAILKHNEYEVTVDVIVEGHCVNHEVDIIAKKDSSLFMVECKYHNHSGIICDVKIPLYIRARFEDIETHRKENPEKGIKLSQGWLITNTRFSDDALEYGLCSGLKMIGWDFPKKGSLKDMIDASGLHPITCLTTLTRYEKQRLLDNRVVLCKELLDNNQALLSINVSPAKLSTVLKEVDTLCK